MIKATVCITQILMTILAMTGTLYILKPKRKTAVAVCFCIALFSFLSLKFTQTFVGVKEQITITAQNKKCDESRGTEVDVLNLRIDGTVITAYDLADGHWYDVSGRYSWRPPEDSRWDGTASTSITLKVPVGWTRSIQFHGNEWRGYVTVEKPDGTSDTLNTYSQGVKIFSCYIGRSDTKLLLLNGILNILCHAVLLTLLTGLFVLTARRCVKNEDTAQLRGKKKDRCLPGTKRPWIKSLVFTGGLAIIIAICAVANLRGGRIKTDAVLLASNAETESAPITATDCYVQTFTSNGTFNQLRLRFCSYGRENQLTTTVKLADDVTGDILESWEVNNSSIIGDDMKLSMQEEKPKGSYRLIIEGHNPDPESSVGIYLQDKSIYNGKLLISGDAQDTDIGIGLYQETKLGYFLLITVLTAAVLCAWIGFALIFVLKLELHKTAFILMIAFGSVYLIIFPTGCINDSWRHYITAYQYSNDLFGIEESISGTVMMRKDDCDEFLRYRGLDRKASISTYYEEADEFSLWCQDGTMQDAGYKSLDNGDTAASSVAYFPQTIGLTIGRLLSLGTVPCMYLARILQLLSVAFIVSVSVKLIPRGKEILLLIALLPIFMQQVTAFSYDGMAFGFAFLFIAACERLRVSTESISMATYMLLLASIIGLCACRGGMYIVLIMLLYLIPRDILNSRSKLNLVGVGVFTVLTFFGKSYLTTSAAADSTNTLVYGSPFHHPVQVGLHFVSSIIENIDIYWGGAFGQQMGWSEGIIPFFMAFGFTLLMLIVSLPDDDFLPSMSRKSRIVYLFPVVLTLGICLLMMYIAESHRATHWNIWGVQGRYLIPVLPLVFLQAQNSYIVLKRNIRPAIIYSFCVWEVVEIFYLIRTFVIR